MKTFGKPGWGVALVLGTSWAAFMACGSDGDSKFNPDGGLNDGGPGTPGFPTGDGGAVDNGPFTDFPKDPIVDTSDGGGASTPGDAPALFTGGTPATGSDGNSPCLFEPEIGSLVPKNWLRPRFRWTATGGANLFEIRLHADNQINDLVVYTSASQWTMSEEMWKKFAGHSAGVGITITVRGGKHENGAVTGIATGSTGPWGIAPADAPGTIVYWRIVGGDVAELKGFVVGEDSVRLALDPPKVKQEDNTKCVGCHISSPDGKYAIFSSANYGGGWGLGIASIEPATEGNKPDFMTLQAEAALETYLTGISTAAAPFWTTGKHLVVASLGGQIRWVNLDGTTDETVKGVVTLTGDTKKANGPNLSHDGAKLVYHSSNDETSGRPSGGDNDIFIVPFNGGAGGEAKGLQGASDPEVNEYYPSFSPDDKLVAFSRSPKSVGNPYAEPNSEVYVVSAAGGAPQRLDANDPPACSKLKSPGMENSWPKWAPAKPAPVTVDGKTYYWLVFSSTRLDPEARQVRQLFMAPVVVDAAGTITKHKAVYLWNQPATEKNHTPAWDMFAIPPVGPK
jgi:hypothetical protein